MAFKHLPVVIENVLLENEGLLRGLSARPRPDMGEVLTLCRNFRIAGIGLLFLRGRTRDFLLHLSHSGRAFAHFLSHAGVNAPRLCRCAPFFDALAAGDFGAAEDIARRSRRTWVRTEEYEEDFVFVDFLMRHFFLGASHQDSDAMLTRWEAALQGSEDVRLAICRALLEKKEAAFNEALEQCLDERRDEHEERAAQTDKGGGPVAVSWCCPDSTRRGARHLGAPGTLTRPVSSSPRRRWWGVERQAAGAHRPKPPASPLRGARPERACAQCGRHGLCTGLAHSSAAPVSVPPRHLCTSPHPQQAFYSPGLGLERGNVGPEDAVPRSVRLKVASDQHW